MKRIVTAREQLEMLSPWRIADISDQPDDVTDDFSMAEFYQWCAHNHRKADIDALNEYAQVSGMSLQDYEDVLSFLDGQQEDSEELRLGKKHTATDDEVVTPKSIFDKPLTWYHNTNAELKPGDEITPAAVSGHQSRWSESPWYNPNYVYIVNSDADQTNYGHHGRYRYEVEPIGDFRRDPEYLHNLEYYHEELNRPEDHPEGRWAEEDVPAYFHYMVPKAKVIRRLWDDLGSGYDSPEKPRTASRTATAPVLDKPADFPDDWFEKHWGDDDDAPLPVPEQTGPPPRPADKVLNEWVKARDSITPENLSDWHAAPWTNPLEETLYKEFQHDWWPGSEAAMVRNPENVNTGWSFHPDEPITHWLNVEDFLNERYPEAATGGKYGLEHAAPMLQRKVDDQMLSPEMMKEYGYVGHGNAITQAMLNLHNKLQGRKWDSPQDRKRYYELMLKHIGPNGKKVSRLAKLIEAMAWDEWAPQIKHYPNSYGGLAPNYHLYQIDHGPEENDPEMMGLDRKSSLSFQVIPNDKEVQIESIDTHPSFRNQGIAEAMMRKLHQEHPGHIIRPGYMSSDGKGFHDRMLEKEPDARSIVAQANQLLRHANYLESPEGRAHFEQLMQMQQQIEKFRNGPHENWYHVSPHDMPEGTKLVPGGIGNSATSQDFYDMGFGDDTGTMQDMGSGRTQHVWVTPDLDDAHFWSATLSAPHIYQVDPHETPKPWNGTGTDGFVSPGATIRKKVSGGQ